MKSKHSSKAARIYDALRDRICDLTLAPNAPLHKDKIAEEFAVSRAPVNDAISRLAEEGLVKVYPQHGSFVAPIVVEEVRESMFIRMALEVEAARRVAAVASSEVLDVLDLNISDQADALRVQDLNRFYELDEHLHASIFAAMGEKRAQELVDRARASLVRVRRLALPDPGRLLDTLAEHRRIVDGLHTRDPEIAAAAMRFHLRSVAGSVECHLRLLDEATPQ